MPDQHRATPEQWAKVKSCAPVLQAYSCLIELRDRIQQLEAAQQAPDPYSGRPSSLTDDQRKTAAALAGARCAIEQLRSKPGSWRPAQPAPSPHPPTLVEEVARIIARFASEGLPGDDSRPPARAVIREVAARLRSEYPQWEGCGAAWADLLDNQANR
jgi:hypothetical protein